jgi:hypothetical protein
MSEYRLVRHRKQWSLAYGNPRQRIATGQDDRGRAELVAGEIWRRINRPAQERVSDLWEPYKLDRIASGGSDSRLKSLWKTLEPHFGYKLGKVITKQDCRDYAAMRKRAGKSNSTVKTELEALRACLRWHYGKEAPVIVAPPPSKPRERYLTKAEAEQLLASIETPRRGWDHPSAQGKATGSPESGPERSCHRICGKARGERQAGDSGGCKALGRPMLSACVPAYRRRVDEPGRRAAGADRAGSRAYVAASHLCDIRSLQPELYEGCDCRAGLVIYRLTDRAGCPTANLGPVARL